MRMPTCRLRAALFMPVLLLCAMGRAGSCPTLTPEQVDAQAAALRGSRAVVRFVGTVRENGEILALYQRKAAQGEAKLGQLVTYRVNPPGCAAFIGDCFPVSPSVPDGFLRLGTTAFQGQAAKFRLRVFLRPGERPRLALRVWDKTGTLYERGTDENPVLLD
jgi:hypothetical protein